MFRADLRPLLQVEKFCTFIRQCPGRVVAELGAAGLHCSSRRESAHSFFNSRHRAQPGKCLERTYVRCYRLKSFAPLSGNVLVASLPSLVPLAFIVAADVSRLTRSSIRSIARSLA